MPINIPNTFAVTGNAVVSGGGGGGGTVSYQLDEYRNSGTWTKPAGFIGAEVMVFGAGGGGASGSRQASGVLSRGGSAGGGGSILLYYFNDADLGATETITIGAGGTAGPSVTVDNTNGSSGGNGGTTSIGTVAVVLGASGATFDNGGGVYAWNSLTPADGSISISGATGQSSSSTGAAGDSFEQQTAFTLASMPRSTAGGGINTSNTPSNGGVGTSLLASTGIASSSGTLGTAPGGSGGNGYGNVMDVLLPPLYLVDGVTTKGTVFYGTSGGAGASSITGGGGNAGVNGDPGPGGAGGGASRNGFISGPGGAGSQGAVKILSIIVS